MKYDNMQKILIQLTGYRINKNHIPKYNIKYPIG